MFAIHALQAACGDCLVLECGTSARRSWVLIDGGPPGTYGASLGQRLQRIGDDGGELLCVVLSHADTDHIAGLIDLFCDLRQQLAPIGVKALWHNSFDATIGSGTDIRPRLEAMMARVACAGAVMPASCSELNTIGEGHKLRLDALALNIPLNDGFQRNLVSFETSGGPRRWDNLEVVVVGPTATNLESLKQEWLAWLDAHEESLATGDPAAAAMADQSKPNLGSVMLYVKDEHGKTALLSGDGRGDHLLQGLGQANLLSPAGSIHVDLFKLPHHGSCRNVTRNFFSRITADHYIASANGKDGNPDYATLKWLVQQARTQQRTITIHVTNETQSTADLLADFDPDVFGYTLEILPPGENAITVRLS